MNSTRLRKEVIRSLVALLLFFLFYQLVLFVVILISLLAIGLAAFILFTKASALTIILSAALVIFSLLILVFMFKFVTVIFRLNKEKLPELYRTQAPEFFAMVEELAREAGVKPPKKITFNSEVNAAVYYSNLTSSLFFPTGKNLLIGFGLVEITSKGELKAIIAHEFGHFAQKSMRVGSYMNQVNRIIHNMLYENNSFNAFAIKVANSFGFAALAVRLAVGVIEVIQNLMRSMYVWLNARYMALSREMEFEADLCAARLAKAEDLIRPLYRTSVADQAIEALKFFYFQPQNGKTRSSQNIFSDFHHVLREISAKNGLSMKGNIPLVDRHAHNRFFPQRLYIREQWASHPEIGERAFNLGLKQDIDPDPQGESAWNYFKEAEAIKEHLSSTWFEQSGESIRIEQDAFPEAYAHHIEGNSFPKSYQGLYDRLIIPEFDLENPEPAEDLQEFPLGEDFADQYREWGFLAQDTELLQLLESKEIRCASFEYMGKKFSVTEAERLKDELKKKHSELDSYLLSLYPKLYATAWYRSSISEKQELKESFARYFHLNSLLEEANKSFHESIEKSAFLYAGFTVEEVREDASRFKSSLNHFKIKLKKILDDPDLQPFISGYDRNGLLRFLDSEEPILGPTRVSPAFVRLLEEAIGSYMEFCNSTLYSTLNSALKLQETLIRKQGKAA